MQSLRLVLSLLALVPFSAAETPFIFTDQFINQINQKATTWKAGRNFPRNTPLKYIRNLLGVLPDSEKFLPAAIKYNLPEGVLPDHFDAREQWTECPVISEIRDQGNCGSCWAISSVEVMSDRTCIASMGQNNFHYSTQDLMSCCRSCGFGCSGGYPSVAFQYWVEKGITSGGLYGSGEGCRPYQVEPCEHHVEGDLPPCPETEFGDDTCITECQQGYKVPYDMDKRHGSINYSVRREEDIKAELVKNGPVVATYTVYEDFLSYKSGVYEHTTGKSLGGHAVKMVGYGVEDGVPFWLCLNSWNTDWGDEGTFKILRGSNECGIERQVVAGFP